MATKLQRWNATRRNCLLSDLARNLLGHLFNHFGLAGRVQAQGVDDRQPLRENRVGIGMLSHLLAELRGLIVSEIDIPMGGDGDNLPVMDVDDRFISAVHERLLYCGGMDLVPPFAPLTMETNEGYKQFWWAGIRVGGRIPTPGERCRPWAHRWTVEEYPGVRGMYRDKVCQCGERKILKPRPYLPGEKPDFRAQVAKAVRKSS